MVHPLKNSWLDSITHPDLAQTIYAFVQQVTGFYYLRDHCEKAYPDFNAHKCALTHGFYKPLSEYNKMLTGMKRIFIPDQH